MWFKTCRADAALCHLRMVVLARAGVCVCACVNETNGPGMCSDAFLTHTAHPYHFQRAADRISEWQGVPLGHVMDAA